MGRLFHPTRLDAPLQAAAVVTALACAHALLVREYRCWLAQTPAGAGHGAVPTWITASLVAAVIVLSAVAVGLR